MILNFTNNAIDGCYPLIECYAGQKIKVIGNADTLLRFRYVIVSGNTKKQLGSRVETSQVNFTHELYIPYNGELHIHFYNNESLFNWNELTINVEEVK